MISKKSLRIRLKEFSTSTHGLILITYTMGFVLLAVLSAVLISWSSTRETENAFLDEGKQYAQLAAQSALIPLLTGSKENSIDYINPVISNSEIKYLEIYDQDSELFYKIGEVPAWNPEKRQFMSILSPEVIHEDKLHWHIVAPVFTGKLNDQRIGIVYLVYSKSNINKLRERISFYTISISALAATVLWLMILFALRRFTLPVQQLAGYMDLSRLKRRFQIPERIPTDVKRIYTSFNDLVEQIEARDLALKNQLVSMEDIIEEKTRDLVEKNEQLEVAHNEAIAAGHVKDLFVANVSHEIRTPIQAIMGYCEILKESCANAELAMISSSSYQLLNIVNDILDISKIESNKIEINPRSISVEDIAREVSDSLLPVIKANHNTFEITIIGDLGCIYTDPAKLTQILSNLLSNAGNYTDHGHVSLAVSSNIREGEVFIEFKVSDTGIGIAEDMIEKIFLPFERADMTKTRRHRGTGLGLAISRKLAGLLGGILTVESEIGKGSTFCLYLPKGVEQPIDLSTTDLPLTTAIIPKSILVAEDHPMISEVFKRILEFDGHSVSIAHDGEEAIDILNKQDFDIGLIDVHMPKIDGVEVISQYLKSHPDTQTRLYILTADITESLRRAAADLGVAIIQKPIDRQNLGRFINQ